MTILSKTMPASPLLSECDPHPVELINETSTHPLLLVCEHAGQAIPARLGGLGISQDALDAHIGWDIGAAHVTRKMAELLDAPAVLQRYSRLVVDCNRPVDAADAMPEISDGITIARNQNLSPEDRAARASEIFAPYQAAVDTMLRAPSRRLVLSIHSFTNTMNGKSRPWEIGFLFRKDTETSRKLEQYLGDRHPNLTIGMNEPYQICDKSDWFVPKHGEANGIPHSLIEIRNDQINSDQGQASWAQTLVAAVTRYLEEN